MTVSKAMNLRGKIEGDVGIEIEVEGRRLPDTLDQYWRVEGDGSLRGESREFVFREPMSLEGADKALKYLSKAYKDNQSRIDDSPRCGVHVHVNCRDISLLHLYNFMTLYLICEEMLVKWCGPTREGNLFCLRAQDAEYLIHTLIQAANNQTFRRSFGTDELRYASMNVKALPQYGSLEFRAMRGTEDMNLIHRWASMLVGLRDAAADMTNPQEIIMATSEGGFDNFIRQIFSRAEAEMFLSDPDADRMLIDGVRRVQEIAYSIDWEEIASLPKRTVGGLAVNPEWDDDFPPTDA